MTTAVSLSPGAELLLDLLAALGDPVGPDTWSTALRAYAQKQNVELPKANLQPVVKELERWNLLLPEEQQRLRLAPEAAEDALLLTRARRRSPALIGIIQRVVFPLIPNPELRQALQFRLEVLFGAPAYQFGASRTRQAQLLSSMARGWRRPESFRQVDLEWQAALQERSLIWACEQLEEAPAALESLQGRPYLPNALLLLMGQYHLFRGQTAQVEALIQHHTRVPALTGMLLFSRSKMDSARQAFEQALKIGQEKYLYLPTTRLMYVITLLTEDRVAEALRVCGVEEGGVAPWLRWLCEQRQGGSRYERPELPETWEVSEWLAASAGAIALQDAELGQILVPAGEAWQQRAQSNGFEWLSEQFLTMTQALREQSQPSAPWDGLKPEASWKRRLERLMSLARAPEAQTAHSERVAWVVDKEAEPWDVVPRLQTLGKKGWTKGRQLERNQPVPVCASESDRNAHRLWKEGKRDQLWQALAGHPAVLDPDSLEPLEVRFSSPELQIRELPGQLSIRLEPPCPAWGQAAVRADGQRCLKVFRYSDRLRSFSEVVGSGLEVPAEERGAIEELLQLMPAEVSVASDVAAPETEDTEERQELSGPRSGLILRIRPSRDGLEMNLLVRPLGEHGPEVPPGQGGRRIWMTRDGERRETVRDLEAEAEARDAFFARCPVFAGDEQTHHWVFPELASCLPVLDELAQLPQGTLRLEWPEGQSLKVRQRLDKQDLKLEAAAQGEWFKVEGMVDLGDGQQWELQQLLDRFKEDRQGRFIALGAGEFLALTDDLRKRLEELSGVLEAGKGGKGLKAHALNATALDDMDVAGDAAFAERLLRQQQSQELTPSLPGTFQAELRDYQMEGFQWLVRRAHLSVGACLADDMGLGKTLQTLALLVERAPLGPTLVIAPTSVCGNWQAEARRFAPTLNLIWLAEGDREAMVREAGPFDLVLVSYGVLTRSPQMLAGRSWSTLVLDEAQAIKNPSTQRFQAATRIPADFRVATTGTPVENRLQELWALFRFLNPGLLGSLESFGRRFAQPIENGDSARRLLLKRLVHPFLLRRTKAQVLDELPPRTEIRLEVDLSDSERTFYEAVRQHALSRVGDGKAEPMSVLAELMKLRRACCHPHLVDPKKKRNQGSKLDSLRELLSELRLGGHRALVFSQFVDHLQLIRESLEEQGISYQYLDGSVPAQERTRRVDAFQAGQGDVFLISLRAGGFGLNLTAADYVIHMDPWWNPAVEDQASDRAHRIGQQRPVTVYRLVARNTVEEKILALHQNKRDLADGLLEGAENDSRLSARELVELMRE